MIIDEFTAENYYENFDFATGEFVVECSTCHEKEDACMCFFEEDLNDSCYLW